MRLIKTILLTAFLLTLILLPFQIWNMVLFPSIYGKILFGGWVTIFYLCFLVLLLCLNKKPKQILFTPLDISLIVYSIFLVVHAAINPAGVNPFLLAEVRMLLLLYFVSRILSRDFYCFILWALIVAAAGQSILGILQLSEVVNLSHPYFRITGTFFNPGPFAGYLAAIFPVVIWLFVIYPLKNKGLQIIKSPIFYLSFNIVLLILLSLIFSGSRAAWISVIVSSVSLLLFYKPRKWACYWQSIKKLKLRAQIGIPSLILLVVFLTTFTMTLYHTNKDSVNGRILVWKGTFEMIQDHLLTGVGINSFPSTYMHYQARYFHNSKNTEEGYLADNTEFAFNEFFRITAEQGVPGLFLLAMVIATFFMPKTTSHPPKMIPPVKAGMVGLMVFACFSYPMSVLPIKSVMVIYLALVADRQHPLFIVSLSANRQKALNRTTALLLIIYLPFIFLKTKELTVATLQWKQVATHPQAASTEKNLKQWEDIYPILKKDGRFLTMYGRQLKHWKNYSEALNIFKKASSIVPSTEVYLNLGDCYCELKNYTEAEVSYRYAKLMIPSRILSVKALARLYLQQGKTVDAINVIENYLKLVRKKRTVASYAIELELIDMLSNIKNTQ